MHACHVRRRIYAWIARLLVYQHNLLPQHHVGFDVLSNLRLQCPQLFSYSLHRTLVCTQVCVCVCERERCIVFVCVCVCEVHVCVCVREREREKERELDTVWGNERDLKTVTREALNPKP